MSEPAQPSRGSDLHKRMWQDPEYRSRMLAIFRSDAWREQRRRVAIETGPRRGEILRRIRSIKWTPEMLRALQPMLRQHHPSVPEIARKIGVSRSVVQKRLDEMRIDWRVRHRRPRP